MCGEKRKATLWRLPALGSPPRMRGKDFHVRNGLRFAGITPACAGKSNFRCDFFHSSRDHPRVCGEKGDAAHRCRPYSGSPPHMRGKASPFLLCLYFIRITPAHAGKSCHRWTRYAPDRDHPRTCGEKLLAPMAYWLAMGSPPHMRGKVALDLYTGDGWGITPAHAGKSYRS